MSSNLQSTEVDIAYRFVVFGDLHLKRTDPLGSINNNGINTRLEDKLTALNHAVEHAISVSASHFFLLGDVFDSINPPETLRHSFWKTLEPLIINNTNIRIIIGNLDSTGKNYNLSGETILLDDHIKVIPEIYKEKLPLIKDKEISLLYIPYIKNTEPIIEAISNPTHILFGHFEIEGAELSPDNSKIRHGINRELLKPFKLVWLGHIHKFQEFWPNCGFLGSAVKCDFGEITNRKVFGDVAISKNGDFKTEYIDIPQRTMITKDILETDPDNLYLSERIPEELKEKDILLKFRFIGSEEWVKAVNKSKFKKRFPNALRIFVEDRKLDTDREKQELVSSYTMLDLIHNYTKNKKKGKEYLEIGKEIVKSVEGVDL